MFCRTLSYLLSHGRTHLGANNRDYAKSFLRTQIIATVSRFPKKNWVVLRMNEDDLSSYKEDLLALYLLPLRSFFISEKANEKANAGQDIKVSPNGSRLKLFLESGIP